MSTLPQLPKRGEDILSWAKRLQRYVRSITPQTGATIKVNQTEGGTTFETRPREDTPYPFQVIPDSDYTPVATNARRVKIRGGRWDNVTDGNVVNSFSITSESPLSNGTGIFSSAGVSNPDLPSAEIPVESNESDEITDGQTVYVYLYLESRRASGVGSVTASRAGDCANADTLQARWLVTTRPEEDNLTQDCIGLKVLAKVTNTGGALTITQEWKGGNIKTLSNVVDSADRIYTATGENRASLDYNSDNMLEVKGFEAADAGKVPYSEADSGADKDLLWAHPGLMDGNATNAQDEYVGNLALGRTSGGAWTPPANNDIRFFQGSYGNIEINASGRPKGFIDFTTSAVTNILDMWDCVYGFLQQLFHDHSEHTFTTDDHVTQGVDRYLINDGNAARNNMQVGSMLGDSSAVNSISPDARKAYNSSGAEFIDWEQGKLTLGATVILNWQVQLVNDLSGNGSIFWHTRELADSTGTLTTLNWNTALLTGKAWECDQYFNMTGTAYQADGVDGWSGTFQALQNGNTVDVTVAKGIITNVS